VTTIKIFFKHKFQLVNSTKYSTLSEPAPSPAAYQIIWTTRE